MSDSEQTTPPQPQAAGAPPAAEAAQEPEAAVSSGGAAPAGEAATGHEPEPAALTPEADLSGSTAAPLPGSEAEPVPLTEEDASIAREAQMAGMPGEQQPAAGDSVEDAESLRARAAERDQYLALAQRTQADFDNFRKRAVRDSALAMEKGAGRLASEMLPALDHLELALKAAEAEGGELFKGVRMVQDELLAALKRAGIETFSPAGEPFDPNLHEAMVQIPVEGAEPGTVVEVYQQGYRINGTVLRPARVVVAA